MSCAPLRMVCAMSTGSLMGMRAGLGSTGDLELAWTALAAHYPWLAAVPNHDKRLDALDSAFQTALARLRLLENTWANMYRQAFLSPTLVALSDDNFAKLMKNNKFIHTWEAAPTYAAAMKAGPKSPLYRQLAAQLYDAYLGALEAPAGPLPCTPTGELTESLGPKEPAYKGQGWWFGTEPTEGAQDIVLQALGLPTTRTAAPVPTHFFAATSDSSSEAEFTAHFLPYELAPPFNWLGPAAQLARATMGTAFGLSQTFAEGGLFGWFLTAPTWALYRDLWTRLRVDFWPPANPLDVVATPTTSVPALAALPSLPCDEQAFHQSVVVDLTQAQQQATPVVLGRLLATSWLRLRRLLALRFLFDRIDLQEHEGLEPLLRDWSAFDGVVVRGWFTLQSLQTTSPTPIQNPVKWNTQVYSASATASQWARAIVERPKLSSLGE